MADQRQLWLVIFRSDFHDLDRHPNRFDHVMFYLPEADVSRAEDLGKGRVIQAIGDPLTGFSRQVADFEKPDPTTPWSGVHLDSVDFEKVSERANRMLGLPVSDHPETGKPNCQGWLYSFAVLCAEDGIMKPSVAEYMRNNQQK